MIHYALLTSVDNSVAINFRYNIIRVGSFKGKRNLSLFGEKIVLMKVDCVQKSFQRGYRKDYELKNIVVVGNVPTSNL
jgi:hypothetical protein